MKEPERRRRRIEETLRGSKRSQEEYKNIKYKEVLNRR